MPGYQQQSAQPMSTQECVVIEIYDAKIEFDYNLICYDDDGSCVLRRIVFAAWFKNTP